MAKDFFVESKTTTRKNPETGHVEEVEDRKLIKVNIKDEDEFFMVYFKYMSPYWGLKYVDDVKIITKLCEWAEFDKGVVYLTSGRRKEIIETLGIHNSNISSSLRRLRDALLISGDNGEFTINPKVFWKGSKASRRQILQNDGIQLQFKIIMGDKYKAHKGIHPNEEYDS